MNRLPLRFFAGAIAVMLTLGASWGTALLWQIASARHFTSLSVQAVNAHGSAQVFGWVGLFVMGALYGLLPRLWKAPLAWPHLANVVLILTLAAIALNSTGTALRDAWAPGTAMALTGSVLHIFAAALFAAQIIRTFIAGRRSHRTPVDPFVGFIFAGLSWFIAMSVLNAWHTYTTLTAATLTDLLWHVATYQAPLRDMQIHGMALTIVLGMSSRLLPELFGLRQTPARRAWGVLALISTAVAGECAIFIAYRWSGNHVIAAFLMIPWMMLAGAVAWMVLPWRLWRPMPAREPTTKFIRAAYGWLFVSLAMLLLLPVYTNAVHLPFSHAYYGAIRHAITVGFLSLMIVGLSSKLAPMVLGIEAARLTDLTGPFVLINAGCALRVIAQSMSDVYPAVFAVIGFSGIFELAAFSWWAAILVMGLRRQRYEIQQPAFSAVMAPASPVSC